MNTVTYVGKKQYEIVRISMGLKDNQGNPIPSDRALFQPSNDGFLFSTDDEAMIKFIEGREEYARGLICRFDSKEAEALKEEALEKLPKVNTGPITSIPSSKLEEHLHNPEVRKRGRPAKIK